MRSPDELTAAFRAKGLRVTPQRQCLFEILGESRSHPSAEAVYGRARERMPTISLKTVYQTLHDLAAMGEVEMLELGTGRTRVDPSPERAHHHLVCRECGRVDDLFVDLGRLTLPPGQGRGFAIDKAEVVFRGRCGPCVGDKPSAPASAETS